MRCVCTVFSRFFVVSVSKPAEQAKRFTMPDGRIFPLSARSGRTRQRRRAFRAFKTLMRQNFCLFSPARSARNAVAFRRKRISAPGETEIRFRRMATVRPNPTVGHLKLFFFTHGLFPDAVLPPVFPSFQPPCFAGPAPAPACFLRPRFVVFFVKNSSLFAFYTQKERKNVKVCG